jgi:CubicO group peptidase (beta-lactamase class C family)
MMWIPSLFSLLLILFIAPASSDGLEQETSCINHGDAGTTCQVATPKDTVASKISEDQPIPKQSPSKKQKKKRRRSPFTQEAIEIFFDEQVPKLMETSHIVGTSLSVVHCIRGDDVSLSLKKGYGMANIENEESVNPDTTLFRPGSISKLFLWTAIMQLVDQGKVDLTQDICVYLSCGEIPSFKESNNAQNYDDITLTHLMSHTPGFEDYMFNVFVKDPARIMTLEQVVSHRTVKRVRQPGTEISYSNYGAMLAGRIVEEVSGLMFEDYMKKHIFEPLRMDNSTFRQPLPQNLASNMSLGYILTANETLEAKEFELIQGVPAGGLSSSAGDMAKFMQAHLSVEDGGAGLLEPDTMEKMHSLLFRPNTSLNMGFAHGFMDMSTNGLRVIGHGGDTIYFHSLLFLVPEYNLGVYFSFNTGKEGMPDFPTFKLFQRFMDNFFPAPTGLEIVKSQSEPLDSGMIWGLYQRFVDYWYAPLPPKSEAPLPPMSEAASTDNKIDYTGTYRTNRRSESDMTKVNSLFMTFSVKNVNETGRLQVSSFLMPEAEEYIEVEPQVFQKVDGQDRLLFLLDSDNQVKSLFVSSLPVMTFIKCSWWETRTFNIPVVLLGQLCVMAGFFVWPLRPVRRFVVSKVSSKPFTWQTSTEMEAKVAERLATAVVVAYFSFYGGLIYLSLASDLIFGGALPSWPFYLPWIAFVSGLPLPFLAVRVWQKQYWGPAFRIFYTLFAVSVQGFFWFLWQWGFVARSL